MTGLAAREPLPRLARTLKRIPALGSGSALQLQASNFVMVFVHPGCRPLDFAVINIRRRLVSERLMHSFLTVEAEVLI